ncbi:S16 family serine protease [Verrucomicrobiota bacterium]
MTRIWVQENPAERDSAPGNQLGLRIRIRNHALRRALLPVGAAFALLVSPLSHGASEMDLWHDAVKVLRTLEQKPGDTEALWELKFVIQALRSEPQHRHVTAALSAVFAVGQLMAGAYENGVIACEEVKKAYPGSEASQLADPAVLLASCVDCAGKGKVRRRRTRPPADAGRSGRDRPDYDVLSCRKCHGLGRLPLEHQVQHAYRTALQKARPLAEQEKEGWAPAEVVFKPVVDRSSTLPPEDRRAEEGKKAGTPFSPLTIEEDYLASPYIVDPERVNLFDGMVFVCKLRGLQPSVDPEVLDAMSNIEASRTQLLSLRDMLDIEELVSPHGFIVKELSLTETQKVHFVTTPASWAYSEACNCLAENDISGASRALAGQGIQEEFGLSHDCASLKLALDDLAASRDKVRRIEEEAKLAVERFKGALRTLKVARDAASAGLSGNRGVASGMALRAFRSANGQLNELSDGLTDFVEEMRSAHMKAAHRYHEAVRGSLLREAFFLLQHMSYVVERLLDMIGDIQEASKELGREVFADFQKRQEISGAEIRQIVDNTESRQMDLTKAMREIGETPEEIYRISRSIEDAILTAERQANTAKRQLAVDPIRASAQYAQAFFTDTGNLDARVGLGWSKVRDHIQGLGDILQRKGVDVTLAADLAKDFQKQRKDSYLESLNAVTYGGTPLPSSTSVDRLGTVAGLATLADVGQLFPLSVRIRPLDVVVVREDAELSWWEEILLKDLPPTAWEYAVSFGDYGTKDLHMIASAIQVCKWLNWKYPGSVQTGASGRPERKGAAKVVRYKKALHVEFHQLWTGKGGASAGTAMAVGGYSFLADRPIMPGTAMTGSVRSDGTVYEVGGISDKVRAAYESDRIDLVIVPKRNEAQLLLVPVDQLCRIVIVCGDDVETYIKYATDSHHKRDAIAKLQEAQLLALLGRPRAAGELLTEIASLHPELYTARRLLDLMALHADVTTEQEGQTDEE